MPSFRMWRLPGDTGSPARANEIYTAKTSTVGSIGVIASGMGYSDLAQKLGVESRTYTAGKSKSRLDPMKPEMPEDVADLKRDLNELHGLFKGWIKECRGDRIVKKGVDLDNDVFTGRTWIGENAYKIGLTDGIAQMGPFIKKKFGDDVRLVTTTSEKANLLSMLAGAFSSQATPEVSVSPEAIGKGIAAGTAEELERKRSGDVTNINRFLQAGATFARFLAYLLHRSRRRYPMLYC
jgi:ClpP class serine protease